MKKHALSWLADRLMPKPVITLDPVVHQIGHRAVAEALATSETLESPEAAKLRADLVAAGAPVKVPALPPITAAQPGTPEYHLGLMNQMIETLSTRIERAETKRADQRKAYEQDREERAAKQVQSDMEQAAEIAGLVKSLEAYKAAHDVLSVPPPAVPAAAREERLKIGSFVDIEGKEYEIVSRSRGKGARRVTLDGRVHYVLPRNIQPPTE